MKKQHLYIGTIVALGTLLYWKFGVKKKQKDNSADKTTEDPEIKETISEDTKDTTISNIPNKAIPQCKGGFTVYYANMKHDYKWNNGLPTVTKTMMPSYPSKPQYMGANGERVISNIEFTYPILTVAPSKSKTSKITTQQYNKACADKRSGSFDNPTGGYKPHVEPTKGSYTGGGGTVRILPLITPATMAVKG